MNNTIFNYFLFFRLFFLLRRPPVFGPIIPGTCAGGRVLGRGTISDDWEEESCGVFCNSSSLSDWAGCWAGCWAGGCTGCWAGCWPSCCTGCWLDGLPGILTGGRLDTSGASGNFENGHLNFGSEKNELFWGADSDEEEDADEDESELENMDVSDTGLEVNILVNVSIIPPPLEDLVLDLDLDLEGLRLWLLRGMQLYILHKIYNFYSIFAVLFYNLTRLNNSSATSPPATWARM